MDGEDRKSDHSDERAENHGAERGDFLSEDADSDGQRNDDKRTGGEHFLRIGAGVNVVVNVERKRDEFLPVNDPVSRENQKEEHELGIGDDFDKIAQSLAQMRGLFFVGAGGLLEEEKDGKKHHEDAGGSRAEDIFNAEILMDVGSDERADETADIHERVVDGIADGADVFLGGASGGADDGGFDESDADCGKHQHDGNEHGQRNRLADRSEPWRTERAKKEIGSRENEISERKGAAETEAVGHGAAKDGEKPDESAE